MRRFHAVAAGAPPAVQPVFTLDSYRRRVVEMAATDERGRTLTQMLQAARQDVAARRATADAEVAAILAAAERRAAALVAEAQADAERLRRAEAV